MRYSNSMAGVCERLMQYHVPHHVWRRTVACAIAGIWLVVYFWNGRALRVFLDLFFSLHIAFAAAGLLSDAA